MTGATKADWHAEIRDAAVEGPWREDDRPTYVVYYVVVTDDRGRRFRHDFTDRSREKVERLLDRVRTAIRFDGFSPVGREHWSEGQPVYGSEEYQATGGDLEHHADVWGYAEHPWFGDMRGRQW